ncbi:MAG: tetratricopeptide repeat protein [Actinomycetota bacterium]
MSPRSSTKILVLVLASVLVAACGKDIDPDQALQEGLAQQQAGNLDAAAEQYQLVLDVRPSDKFANYNLGVIEQADGRAQLAEGYYRAALDTDPNFVSALFNLAILRTGVGATQEAIDLYLRVIELQPDYAAAHFNLGILYRDAGKPGLSGKYLNEALALDPSLADRLTTTPVVPGTTTSSEPPIATPS